jgi:hypothetical protein
MEWSLAGVARKVNAKNPKHVADVARIMLGLTAKSQQQHTPYCFNRTPNGIF